METFKLRVKIGDNEFEAEGPEETVRAQFDRGKSLVESTPAPPRRVEPQEPDHQGENDVRGGGVPTPHPVSDFAREQLAKIFQADDRRQTVALRVQTTGERRYADAALLTLYGFHVLRGQDEVPTTRLMDALEIAGLSVPRIDRPVAPYVREGLILTVGSGKGTRRSEEHTSELQSP